MRPFLARMSARAARALDAVRRRVETRSATPSTWDFLRTGADYQTAAGVYVSPLLAENLSTVCACVQAIAETVAMLPVRVYRKLPDGSRVEDPRHPIARLFGDDGPNPWQCGAELVEMMTAHCALRGNAYAVIERDDRTGAPRGLTPYPPDHVSLVRIVGGRGDPADRYRLRFDVSEPEGGTRRVLPHDMLVLRDRTDDGIVGKSRLTRARETFGVALASERYAASTFRNGAAMSGILSHPEHLGEEAARNLRESFKATYAGVDKAGEVAVLEEGLKWQQISVSPADAEMLASRRFAVEEVCRIFRVPPPVVGALERGNYSALSEVGRWFYLQTIMPWLTKWERALERSLLTPAGRRAYEVEIDADDLLRGDLLTRYQAYRIGREIGLVNANELRRWERLNPRTDDDAETFFSPANMQPEQTGRPRADRTPGGLDAE